MRPTLPLAAFALASATTSAFALNEAPPNAPDQQPAFEGQTRAPELPNDVALTTTNVVEGLENPWGMDELTGGVWVVTEKPGRMRLIGPDGAISAPLSGLPEVDARGQGGLLDVAVADDFNETRRIWWTFAQPREDGKNATAVATGTLSADSTAIEGAKVIFQQQPAWDSDKHFGSRLVFADDGALFVTTGERSNPEPRQLAQDVTTHLGKVLRINPMDGAADGNPSIEGGQPEIWSYGHRNLQSAALGPDGAVWTVEHGPKGGDELNRPEAGKNYGWPVITYGIDYSGAPIGDGITAQDGMEQPIYYWDPVIGPSGMVFYDGDMFPEWQGDALIGGLAVESLVRLDIDGDKVAGEARHLEGIGRVRDVDVASDGSLMILTDETNGALIRVSRDQ